MPRSSPPWSQNVAFLRSLTLEGGIRYSAYKVDVAGRPGYDTTTYKAGGSWQPIEGIKVRGNYQRAVRAPNVSELFSPVNTGLTQPVRRPLSAAGPDDQRQPARDLPCAGRACRRRSGRYPAADRGTGERDHGGRYLSASGNGRQLHRRRGRAAVVPARLLGDRRLLPYPHQERDFAADGGRPCVGLLRQHHRDDRDHERDLSAVPAQPGPRAGSTVDPATTQGRHLSVVQLGSES